MSANNAGMTFGTEMKEFPPFLEAGIQYLRQHCLEEEGLFRVSGDNNLLTVLKERVQQNKPIDMEKDCGVLQNRPHNIANLLKWYLRELPEPLCTFECYDMFVATDSIPNENNAQVDCLRKVIGFLPTNNRKLLEKFCHFLYEVHKHSNVNRMNAAALSIVFAPNILKPASNSKTTNPLAIMSELRTSQQVVENIIKHADYLFAEESKTKKTDQSQIEGATVKDITKAIRRLTVKLSKEAESLQGHKDGEQDQNVILEKMRRNSELQKELLQTMDQLEASTAPSTNVNPVKMTMEDLSILTEMDDILTLKILFENGVVDEAIFNQKKAELMNKQKQ